MNKQEIKSLASNLAISIVISLAILTAYGYFIAIPLNKASKDIANTICINLHLNCGTPTSSIH